MSAKSALVLAMGLSLTAVSGCEVGYGNRHEGGYVAVAPPPADNPPPSGVVVQEAPPPEPVEQPIGIAPGPDYVWVGGFYTWDGGRYVWRPGHWDRPPHRGARYDRGHWERGPRGYIYIGGGWR